jgi:hypothetical protein
MQATIGDKIVVHSHHVGEHGREAIILDVEGADGAPPYKVRWSDDGHEGVFLPPLGCRCRASSRFMTDIASWGGS